MEKTKTKSKHKFTVPHTYVIIFMLIVIAALATYVVPSGSFDRVVEETTKRTLVVANSYKSVEQHIVETSEMFTAFAINQ